jgi:general stress protein 26
MARTGIDNLENLKPLKLEPDAKAVLLESQTECTFVFCAANGWPRGVIMSFMHEGDSFWFTATTDRAHVRALADDPRVSLVVSSTGTGSTGRQMLAIRGVAIVHKERKTKDWFFPKFAQRLAPKDPQSFIRLLDSENRVVIEVRQVAVSASHDSRKMAGDGRGLGVDPAKG